MIQYLSVYVHHPGGGRLEAGCWMLEAGGWMLEAGCSKLEARRRRLEAKGLTLPASSLFQDLVCNQTHYVRESGHI